MEQSIRYYNKSQLYNKQKQRNHSQGLAFCYSADTEMRFDPPCPPTIVAALELRRWL